MLKWNSPYERDAWAFTMQRIGQGLRDLYDEPAGKIPREWRGLVKQIAGEWDDQSRRDFAASEARRHN